MKFLQVFILILFVLSISYSSRVIPAQYSYTFQRHYPQNLIPCILSDGSEVNITLYSENWKWWYISERTNHTGIKSPVDSFKNYKMIEGYYNYPSSFSIEMWFSNIKNCSDENTLLNNVGDLNSYYPVIRVCPNTSCLKIQIDYGGLVISSFTVLTPNLSNEDYYHLIVNWEPGNQTVYLNNIEIGTGSLPDKLSLSFFPMDTLEIEHSIYYVGVYNKILTKSEVEDNYLSGIPGWFNQTQNTILLNNTDYLMFDFNDFYLLTNSSIYQIEILTNSSNSSFYCELYTSNSSVQIFTPYNLPITSSLIYIQTPIFANENIPVFIQLLNYLYRYKLQFNMERTINIICRC
ncbi:hypothetical protein M0811_05276 [Anaeramoeba ignava]|uniref:Uncharacterized protein n=1 Tax=Anaeramoeba ignava TaxID=1746090 RepID=A0A9Q0LT21_ANAIG|nr:hypothetical protein M0811_05276 [Anaeramoeba ignava]